MAIDNKEIIIKMEKISKRFGGNQALKDVDLELYKGEVLALVGDNGAGKSTLIKVLTGDIIKDSGNIYFKGNQVSIKHPNDSIVLGIEAIYQDLSLIGTFDLAANLFLGKEKLTRRFGIPLLNKRLMVQESLKIIRDRLGLEIKNVYDSVFTLSGGQQQAVAIARALSSNAEVIIMDEPTAALGVEGTRKLIALINKLKSQGIAIIIISHNLEDVFQVADRITVLRMGEVCGTLEKDKTNREEVVSLMVYGNLDHMAKK